ncbi:MAG: hypothetical protein Q7O66_03475 [Dehalococcoidia bacterium]|nr:hypothetical protein [Dehalococcoidia bacterium]
MEKTGRLTQHWIEWGRWALLAYVTLYGVFLVSGLRDETFRRAVLDVGQAITPVIVCIFCWQV